MVIPLAHCSRKSRTTQRAPDWWESARFHAVSWTWTNSGKAARSRPAQCAQQVRAADSRPRRRLRSGCVCSRARRLTLAVGAAAIHTWW